MATVESLLERQNELLEEAVNKLGAIWDELDRIDTYVREVGSYPRQVQVMGERKPFS